MDNRSDLALMRAARVDPRAFGVLSERYVVALHAWFRRRVGEPAATDLTAETLALAWASRKRFRGGELDSPAAWLFAIALNQYRRYRRRSRVETRARDKLGMPRSYAGPDEIDDADARIDAAQAGNALRDALAQLSPEQREALELRIVEDLSFAEVAERMSTSEPTARMRVMRALRAIRTAMSGGTATP